MSNFKSLVFILILFFMSIPCNGQAQSQTPRLSIEACHRENTGTEMLITGWYPILESGSGMIRNLNKTNKTPLLDPCPTVTAEDIVHLEIMQNKQGNATLSMKFGQRGIACWKEATAHATDNTFAFVVDDKLHFITTVHSSDTASITIHRDDYPQAILENIKCRVEHSRYLMQTFGTDKLSLDNTLHERWSISNKQDRGAFTASECNFYHSGIFNIRLERKTPSGHYYSSLVTGHYLYNPSTKKITLLFDGQSDGIGRDVNGKRVPVSYHNMQGLAESAYPQLSTKSNFPALMKSCLHITDDSQKGRIKVRLHAWDETSKEIPFGEIIFSREEIKDGSENIFYDPIQQSNIQYFRENNKP